MKLKNIIDIIEKEYPKDLAYDWDNSGLFYGDLDFEIKKVMITLDITVDVINQAIKNEVNLIISHHPILMSKIMTLSDNSMQSEMIKLAIKNNIFIYSAHTNMDTAKNGINKRLASLFKLKDVDILLKDKPYDDCGLGIFGTIDCPTDLYDFCNVVKENLKTPFVRVVKENKKIKKIAIASGSCSEIIPVAIDCGCDVIITGDMKYHNSIEYVYGGISIIDAGHFPTERIVLDMFYELLSGFDFEIIKAEISDIFKVI